MYVCMCNGVTSQAVAEAVANGADTTKKVAAATGAGDTCGRCKATIRQIIAAVKAGDALHPPPPKRRPDRWI
jgi:bacterioferritin-associated ferredoxin